MSFVSHRELSFEKGDFLELTHLVDGNWLEGSFKGKTGIFPKAYVKVEYRELLACSCREVLNLSVLTCIEFSQVK